MVQDWEQSLGGGSSLRLLQETLAALCRYAYMHRYMCAYVHIFTCIYVCMQGQPAAAAAAASCIVHIHTHARTHTFIYIPSPLTRFTSIH
jgi:hypothetical protein